MISTIFLNLSEAQINMGNLDRVVVMSMRFKYNYD